MVDVGGQSEGDEQVFDVEWVHTLMLGQFPPGFAHDARLLYLHWPMVAQGLLSLQGTPVAEQKLDAMVGQGVSGVHWLVV
jgi:hypothetical protein